MATLATRLYLYVEVDMDKVDDPLDWDWNTLLDVGDGVTLLDVSRDMFKYESEELDEGERARWIDRIEDAIVENGDLRSAAEAIVTMLEDN